MSSSHSLPPHTPVSRSSEPEPKKIKQASANENNASEVKSCGTQNSYTTTMRDICFDYSSLRIVIPDEGIPNIQMLTSRSTSRLELRINNASIKSIKSNYNMGRFNDVVSEVTKVLENKQNIDLPWLYAMRASAYCHLHESKLAKNDYDQVLKRDTEIAARLKTHMANGPRFFLTHYQPSFTLPAAGAQQEPEQKDIAPEPTTLSF